MELAFFSMMNQTLSASIMICKFVKMLSNFHPVQQLYQGKIMNEFNRFSSLFFSNRMKFHLLTKKYIFFLTNLNCMKTILFLNTFITNIYLRQMDKFTQFTSSIHNMIKSEIDFFLNSDCNKISYSIDYKSEKNEL